MKRLIAAAVPGFILITVCLPVAAAAQSQAQTTGNRTGLTVSPAIFEMTVEPGEVKEREFFVINIKDKPVPIVASIKSLHPVEEIIDPSLSQSFNAASWIEMSESSHILSGKERRRLTAKVSVPANAEPGGHYATILLEPLVPVTTSRDNSAKVAAQVGVLVFITVKGDTVIDASFTKEPQISRLHTSRKVPVEVRVANTGNIHVLPTAKITVRNILGFTKDELPLKPRIVLPNTIKGFSTEWQGPRLFGIYSIQATGTYGSNQTELVGGRRFFVVVRWLPLILTLLLLAVSGRFVQKTYKRWPRAIRAFKSGHPNRGNVKGKNLPGRRKNARKKQ